MNQRISRQARYYTTRDTKNRTKNKVLKRNEGKAVKEVKIMAMKQEEAMHELPQINEETFKRRAKGNITKRYK